RSSAGGLTSHGALTVRDCAFSGNTTPGTGFGGGISNVAAPRTVVNSTFAGNSAGFGGGIFNTSQDNNGIFSGGPVTVINSTFSGNSAGRGGIVVNNGLPGMLGGETLTLINTIVANSILGDNCAVGVEGGRVTDGGHNI